MKLKIFLASTIVLSQLISVSFAQKTELLILPTIHAGHKRNVSYNFDHVRNIIKNFKPDIIALEIRPEDLDQDTSYLHKFYNPEMVMFRNEFPEAKKAGIDFMGADVAGKPLPDNFLKDSLNEFGKFRLMNQKLMRDSAIVKARIEKGLPDLISKRGKMMAGLGANQLMTGEYDALTEEFTVSQAKILRGTPYQYYDDFQVMRDQKIADNIKSIALKNKGKRIIVLTGANHRNRAVKLLRMVRSVKLVNLVQDN
ncbi:MAG: hypothetical protein Q8S11_17295 [Daejeonella sp.]|uniref:hypothetical protein n=1 Tax=Daejeonella sp. TaxID=2805397 RepID=UPI002732CDF3|nr:hypothetical protein [Daejeonella sp.]MDP3470101.1 hypothetical protein [Daejeonella sp.]